MRTFAEITRRLRFTLRRKGQTVEEAEDIVQDAILKFEIYRQERAVNDPEAFITRTAFNLAIDRSRRSKRFLVSSEPVEYWDPRDLSPDQSETLIARLSLARLKAGLATLNPKTQEILLLHRLDGLSYAEIARREGVSETAVIKRVARAVALLQSWMEEW